MNERMKAVCIDCNLRERWLILPVLNAMTALTVRRMTARKERWMLRVESLLWVVDGEWRMAGICWGAARA